MPNGYHRKKQKEWGVSKNEHSRSTNSGGKITLRKVPSDYAKQGVCRTVALPITLKGFLQQKEELWKLKYFTIQKYNLQHIL
jgi:hypothetical protein